MNENDIKHFALELDWSLPRAVQKHAIDALSAADEKYYPLILDKTRKSTWENSVAVIERIGYPKNKTLLHFLVWLLQDVNWPGAAEAIRYLSSLSRDVLIPLAKEALYIADKNDDFMWIGGIRLLIETAGYKKSDFDADIDRILKKADF